MNGANSGRGRGPMVILVLVLIGVVIAAWILFRSNRHAFVDREAPEETSGGLAFAGSEPPNPFHLENGNLLVRTAFSAPGPPGSQIEVRDYEFPPHSRTNVAGLPGPALVEVYSGTGSLSVGGTTPQLAPGVITTVPAQQALDVNVSGDSSLVVRLYLVEGK